MNDYDRIIPSLDDVSTVHKVDGSSEYTGTYLSSLFFIRVKYKGGKEEEISFSNKEQRNRFFTTLRRKFGV